MLVDMHAHYPMHVLDNEPHAGISLKRWEAERWRAGLVNLISKHFNYEGPNDTPSVTMKRIREGDVGVVLSVLYYPADEIEAKSLHGAPPSRGSAQHLLDQLQEVEDQIERDHADVALVVRSRSDLDRALREGRTAMVHCVEGGFALGADDDEVRATVATLAERGVAYVTLAHLFYRQVATNAAALPFLPDPLYHVLFHQPREGLSDLGRAAVEALVENRVLIDVTHMSSRSLKDTLDRLEKNPAARDVPVIASHGACRLGRSPEYNLKDREIKRIAGRGGVVALIDAAHYLAGKRGRQPKDVEESVALICRHIDRIRDLTGSFDHVAIGSDLDGFIKPSLPGLKDLGQMTELQSRLGKRYGPADAEKICSANALRMLHYRFSGASGGAPSRSRRRWLRR
jgi:microsomal dipeptidase-like Zn-dependent dipeptidase